MTDFVCMACGAQFPAAGGPPARCPICEDERQYGHFDGGTVLHWAGGADGRGTLLSGDIVQVIPDRRHVGFMYSYPNLIPLPAAAVEAIRAALDPFAYDVIYGAWWDALEREDGKAAVERSAERYVPALS